MKRHLASTDSIVREGVYQILADKFAEDVISGRIIHNVETDTFCLRETASEQFIADATAAYSRLIKLSDER